MLRRPDRRVHSLLIALYHLGKVAGLSNSGLTPAERFVMVSFQSFPLCCIPHRPFKNARSHTIVLMAASPARSIPPPDSSPGFVPCKGVAAGRTYAVRGA
jgi:hypothetical protein